MPGGIGLPPTAPGSYGEWKTGVITVTSNATTTPEIDLGGSYQQLQVEIPTIIKGDVSFQVSRTSGGTFQTLGTGTAVIQCGAGDITTSVLIGGYQYIKVVTSGTQTSNVTFRVRGSNVSGGMGFDMLSNVVSTGVAPAPVSALWSGKKDRYSRQVTSSDNQSGKLWAIYMVCKGGQERASIDDNYLSSASSTSTSGRVSILFYPWLQYANTITIPFAKAIPFTKGIRLGWDSGGAEYYFLYELTA